MLKICRRCGREYESVVGSRYCPMCRPKAIEDARTRWRQSEKGRRYYRKYSRRHQQTPCPQCGTVRCDAKLGKTKKPCRSCSAKEREERKRQLRAAAPKTINRRERRAPLGGSSPPPIRGGGMIAPSRASQSAAKSLPVQPISGASQGPANRYPPNRQALDRLLV